MQVGRAVARLLAGGSGRHRPGHPPFRRHDRARVGCRGYARPVPKSNCSACCRRRASPWSRAPSARRPGSWSRLPTTPIQDNGIKIFGPDGFKLPDETEAAIEAAVVSDRHGDERPCRMRIAHWARANQPGGRRDLRRFPAHVLPAATGSNGFKVVLDCAHGATYRLAPRVFAERAAAVEALNVHPDGCNINRECGSQHPQGLATGGRPGAGRHRPGVRRGRGPPDRRGRHRGRHQRGPDPCHLCALPASLRTVAKQDRGEHRHEQREPRRGSLRAMGVRHVATQVGDRHVDGGHAARGGRSGRGGFRARDLRRTSHHRRRSPGGLAAARRHAVRSPDRSRSSRRS